LVQRYDRNAATKRDPEFPKRIFEQQYVRTSYVGWGVHQVETNGTQDVHQAFIRLCKRYRFTERAARELIPYMYTGPAARQYTKVKKRSPQATTEELVAEMAMIYINGVTQRQASEEIRKLRLSATASSGRAAADDLIERLYTISVSSPPGDWTDEAMTNTY
jgi:hypothetical protein